MILGQAQFGTAILGSDEEEFSFKIYSIPATATVTVTRGATAPIAKAGIATGAVSVAGLLPTESNGTISFMEQVVVAVDVSGWVKTTQASVPATASVAVATGVPTNKAQTDLTLKTIAVDAREPAFIVSNTAGQATVSAAGVGPATTAASVAGTADVVVTIDDLEMKAGSTPDAATVSVAGGELGTKSVSVPSVTVTVTPGVPKAKAASAPQGVAITVEAANPTTKVASLPTGAAVSVAGGATSTVLASSMEQVTVSVANNAPTTKVVSSPGAVAIVATTYNSATGAASTPEVVALVVSTESPATAASTATTQVRVWVKPGTIVETAETENGLVVVLNANTLAVSEYNMSVLDIVELDDTAYFLTQTGLMVFDDEEDRDFTPYIQTGQLTLGSRKGKRCTSVAVDTTTATNPTVYLIDQEDTQYGTIARSGALGKRLREYNTPRGLLTNSLGIKIAHDELDVQGLTVTVTESGRV